MKLLASSLLLACAIPLGAQTNPSPVNPHATPEARALLHYLYSISGQYTLTGQHNYANRGATWTDRALDLTGKYPAIYGQDFGFQDGTDKDSILARPALVEEAIRQYRNGAIVTLTWHAVRPTDDEPVTFRDSVQGHLTDFEWRELLTPGTALYKRWCAQVDVIAGYLKQLQEARVPVLWRPYHEVNGNWFWWGGRSGKDGSAALYRQLFDRLVNHHKLNNLIWVWNANAPGSGGSGPGPYTDYFPGSEYADVLSVDIYGEFQQSFHDDLVTLAAGKPVALGEVGAVPSPAVLARQPRYAWFMSWSEIMEEGNTLEALRATYSAPNTASRDDPRVAGAVAAIYKASPAPEPELVTPKPASGAKDLLATLYGVTGKSVLSGQDNDAQAVAGATEQIVAITTKSPAIYGQDLGGAKEGARAIIEEAKRQHKNHAMVTLSWHPVRPTGEAATGKLTDFEWTELLTPGTNLYQRWCAQVDEIAGYLKELQDADVAVLWRPYPQPNGDKFWWAGRMGNQGSAALYRQLFDRLVDHHKLRNLVWVWDAAPSSFGPDAPGLYSDYFPGLLYVDALALDVRGNARGWRRDLELSRFGVGKVIGLGLDGWVPDAAMLDQQSKWAWFLASSDVASTPGQADALRKLYASPRVEAHASSSGAPAK
ncbi:MAG: glycosyl hydrolase [Bryobacteraceae bacterium]|jgi:mannan endo-1,4-beta-mannosidase